MSETDVNTGGAEGQANWRESIPEQLRDAPYFKSAQSIDQVLADLNGAAAWQGNSIRIPGPDASDEDVAKFRQKAQDKIGGMMAVPDPDSEDYTDVLRKLGMPEAADKYKAPEDCPIEGDELGQLMANAFEAGLTQKQFQTLINKQAGEIRAAQEQFEAEQVEQYAALKGEWGEAYDDRMDTVGRFLETAPESLRDMPLDAETTRWLYDLADSFNEGNQQVRQADGGDATLTPGEAIEQANEILVRLKGMRQADNPQLYQRLMHKRIDLLRKAG